MNNGLNCSALKINMTAIEATATLYPDAAKSSKASNAIDRNTEIGHSGAIGWRNCTSTSTKQNYAFVKLTYLKIDLGKLYYISAIRLHLRDNSNGVNRQKWQNGLSVELINSSSVVHGKKCGDTYVYNAANRGQSPFFPCINTASGILITLRRQMRPLQVCEVEAFGGLNSEYCHVCIKRQYYSVKAYFWCSVVSAWLKMIVFSSQSQVLYEIKIHLIDILEIL